MEWKGVVGAYIVLWGNLNYALLLLLHLALHKINCHLSNKIIFYEHH
jgi:hypothetical protein